MLVLERPARLGSVHVSGSSDQYVRITSTNSANAGIEFETLVILDAHLIYSKQHGQYVFYCQW